MTRGLARNVGITADFTAVNRYQDQSSVDLNLPDPVTKAKPYQQFGRVTQLQSAMNTTYRALFVKLDKHFSNHWSALVSYTLSAARDLPIGNDLGDVYGYSRENGYSLADRRHKLVASGMVELPFATQLTAIMDLRTAQPFNPATSTDINKDGYTSDIPPAVAYRSGCRDLNLAAVNSFRTGFGLPAVSSVACPGFANLDLRFSKFINFSNHR